MEAVRKLIPDICGMSTTCRACNGEMRGRPQEQVCWDHVKDHKLTRGKPYKNPQVWETPIGGCVVCGEDLYGKRWTAIHTGCVNVIEMESLL